jgi:hypothetical protein
LPGRKQILAIFREFKGPDFTLVPSEGRQLSERDHVPEHDGLIMLIPSGREYCGSPHSLLRSYLYTFDGPIMRVDATDLLPFAQVPDLQGFVGS